MRIASNTFWLSDDRQPSVPMPSVMPRSRILRAAAMPEPSFRLLPGLCATDAPAVGEPRHVVVVEPDRMRGGEVRRQKTELVQMADQRRAVFSRTDHRLHLRFGHMHLHADAVCLGEVAAPMMNASLQ